MSSNGKIASLHADDIARYRSLLSERQAVLRAALRDQLEARDRPAHEASAAEVHDLKDEAFAGQLANLRDVAHDQVAGELAAVRAALGRIVAGRFGRCEECEKEIGRERLLAQPSAARCLSCQDRLEAPERRRR